MAENRSSKPIFDTDAPNRSFFVVELPILASFYDENDKDDPAKPSRDCSPKTPVKTPEMILKLFRKNPLITFSEISNQTNKSLRAVKRACSKLVKEGRLKRIGPKNGGYWEVINK